MVPSHRRVGFADAAALFPGVRIFELVTPSHAWVFVGRDKGAAGGTPAAPAGLVLVL
jgi:hypothetical protein